MAGKKGRSGRKKQEPQAKTMSSATGSRRQGGKEALMIEAQELETRTKPPEKELSEREKLDKKYMETAYGNPESPEEEEETQEEPEEETTEELEPEEVSEEVEQETSPEEQSPEAISAERYQNAVDRMHEATTEAANQRKYIDEIGRFVDWGKYQNSIKGQNIEGQTETASTKAKPPPMDLMLQDYEKWWEAVVDAAAQRITPKVSNQVTEEAQGRAVLEKYHEDFKELPNRERFLGTLYAIGQEEAKKDPSFLQKSYMERYEMILPEFRKTIAGVLTKTPGKKKVIVESPSKSKEREVAEQEQPLTMDDVEKKNRDYVKFRASENRRLQGSL